MSKRTRFALVALTVLSGFFVLPRTALADECTYTWGEAQHCWTQLHECRLMGLYTEEQCIGAFNICNELVCLTLHPGCEDYCSALPQLDP